MLAGGLFGLKLVTTMTQPMGYLHGDQEGQKTQRDGQRDGQRPVSEKQTAGAEG